MKEPLVAFRVRKQFEHMLPDSAQKRGLSALWASARAPISRVSIMSVPLSKGFGAEGQNVGFVIEGGREGVYLAESL